MIGQTSRFGNCFQLPINVLGVALFADADRTDGHNVMLGINSVDDAVITKFVPPIICQRTAQGQPVALRVNG